MLTLPKRMAPTRSEWALDPGFAFIDFSALHMGIARIRGRFEEASGHLILDESDPARSFLSLTVRAGSATTGSLLRDACIRSERFLDAARHPTITFEGYQMVPRGGAHYFVGGRLSLLGSVRPVHLKALIRGRAVDPMGCERLGMQGRLYVDRSVFGLAWKTELPPGCAPLSRHVSASIEAQFVRIEDAPRVA